MWASLPCVSARLPDVGAAQRTILPLVVRLIGGVSGTNLAVIRARSAGIAQEGTMASTETSQTTERSLDRPVMTLDLQFSRPYSVH